MVNVTNETKGITRRSLLKTTALLAGTAALAPQAIGCSTLQELPDTSEGGDQETVAAQTQEFLCCCHGNCDNDSCSVYVTVRDGKVVNLRRYDYGDIEQQGCCQRCYGNIERMYSDRRILHPMRRVGERGSGEFEVITWDEAIEDICTNLKRVADEYGPESVVFMPGSGNSMLPNNYYVRLANYIGAARMAAMFDQNGQQAILKRMGDGEGYMPRADDYRRMLDAKYIFIWGTNPSESMSVSYRMFTLARERGAKLICIDPIYNTIAAHSDIWVPIRPGSDGLLAMAMLKIAIRDGHVDEEFLRTRTVAPYLVKDADGMYLRLSDLGRAEAGSEEDAVLVYDPAAGAVPETESTEAAVDGTFEVEGIAVTCAYTLLKERAQSYDLDDIAEKTDIPLETIEELAAQYAEGPSWIQTGFGIDHYGNGYTYYVTALALACVTGMMAKEGCGYAITDSDIRAQGANMGKITATEEAPNGPTYSCSISYDIVKNNGIPGYWEHPIKALWPFAGNPIHNNAERKKWIEIYNQLEYAIQSDFELSETCLYADIVLPAAFVFERTMLANHGSEYLRLSEKAAEPIGEAKDDIEIFNLVGQGMGFADAFTMTTEEVLAASLDNDAAREYGITWEKLKEEKVMHAFPDYIPMRGEGPVPSDTGRIQIYMEDIKPLADEGQEWDWRYEALPYWEPPLEAWPDNPKFEQYPIVFTTERSKFMVHSMHAHVPTFREIQPEPVICVNPEDAQARGIADGDVVRVHNDRGHVVIKCAYHAGVRPGMVVMDHGWDWDQFIDGHYSDISSIINNRAVPNQNYFDILCDYEKYDA